MYLVDMANWFYLFQACIHFCHTQMQFFSLEAVFSWFFLFGLDMICGCYHENAYYGKIALRVEIYGKWTWEWIFFFWKSMFFYNVNTIQNIFGVLVLSYINKTKTKHFFSQISVNNITNEPFTSHGIMRDYCIWFTFLILQTLNMLMFC